MQASAAPMRPIHPPPVKIYNAVYSSVQVYECMVRGIAVMRRRVDSYVNATQILKVAGVDKGRRTKILEKEILPGKHEIVQGGYGKYQGTWIPLERGRDVAIQYGVAPLLAPLFDFVPNPGQQAPSLPPLAARTSPRPGPGPPTPGASFTSNASASASSSYVSSSLAPPPIMPGSALRLLNQGRAQGLFTPSTSGISVAGRPASTAGYYSGVYSPGSYPYPPGAPMSPAAMGSPAQPSLKRARTESDIDMMGLAGGSLAPAVDTQMAEDVATNGHDGPSPTKRARTGLSPPPAGYLQRSLSQPDFMHEPQFRSSSNVGSRGQTATPLNAGGPSRPASAGAESTLVNGDADKPQSTAEDDLLVKNFVKPSIPRHMDRTAPAKDVKRAAVVAAICGEDNPDVVLKLLGDIPADDPEISTSNMIDIDLILDEHGHTALHLAASMAQHRTVTALLSQGADPHRGNYNGETALMRACLATPNADKMCFNILVFLLHSSIRTLDSARKSVLHHIVALGGVKGRAQHARYYLEGIFEYIAEKQGGEFRTLVDLQDEHGDTALNVAARVGNRSLVRTLLDVGANRVLPNKLGLRPGDFGVETEALGAAGSRADDILSSLRSAPPAPVQKSQDVIADMTTMINNLSQDFQVEIKTKQDALDLTQTQLRAATRQLADQRKQLQTWQTHCGELEQVTQRARNLEKSLEKEEKYPWDRLNSVDRENRVRTNSQLSLPPPPPYTFEDPHPPNHANEFTADSSTIVDGDPNEQNDPPIPTSDTIEALIQMRRMKQWYLRTEEILRSRMKSLQGASAEKEFQCKKIVALCAGMPIDKIDDLLENLVIALESETQVIEIGRVSGFMQKVRDGLI